MDSVQVRKIDLGMEVATTDGGTLLMDEYTCSVLTMNTDSESIVIRFEGCTQVKFGYPNDEAQDGHPLYSNCGYGLHEVFGSDWFDALQEQNRVRFPDVEWARKRHFILLFHASMGEFLADDFRVEVFDGGFDDMAMQAMRRALRYQETCPPSLLPHPKLPDLDSSEG